MKTHVIDPALFDGNKFAARYGLQNKPGFSDFFIGGDGLLHYPDSLPDEPIFDPPDPIVFAPPGIHVHTMRKADAKIGGNFVTTGNESNCIHAVLNSEAQLNDPWLISIPMDAGSSAYCKDTEKHWLWNGTMWKKP